jgi:DNA-binding NarL/FixJ family response regulator
MCSQLPDDGRGAQEIGSTGPDVILTDIGLPGMNGVEGTRILRERFPRVPILALTVYDDDESVFDAICAGASDTC